MFIYKPFHPLLPNDSWYSIRNIRKTLKYSGIQIKLLREKNDFLKRLAAEYTILEREWEHEHMTDAAIRNYEKALELYPDAGDARRRLKKCRKNNR